MDNITELEEIRRQMGELKQRLDRETTLNERLLHDSLKMKMDSVHILVRKTIAMGTAGIALWFVIGREGLLSSSFIVFTCLMMLVSMTAEYLINRMADDDLSANLSDTVARLVRMKTLRLRQTLIGIAVLVFLWLPWLTYEFRQHLDDREYMIMTIGAAVGCVIGITIGLTIFFKMQRANDEMIRLIEDFTKTDL